MHLRDFGWIKTTAPQRPRPRQTRNLSYTRANHIKQGQLFIRVWCFSRGAYNTLKNLFCQVKSFYYGYSINSGYLLQIARDFYRLL
jgi:hypothetical protein